MPVKTKTQGKKVAPQKAAAPKAAKASPAKAKPKSTGVAKGGKKVISKQKPAKAAKPAPKAAAKSSPKAKTAAKPKAAAKAPSKVKAKAAPKKAPVKAAPAKKTPATVKKATAKPSPKAKPAAKKPAAKAPAKPAPKAPAKPAAAKKPAAKPAAKAPAKAAAPKAAATPKSAAKPAVKEAPPAPKRAPKPAAPPPMPLGKMPRRTKEDDVEITIEPPKGPVKMTTFLVKQKKRLIDLRDAYLNAIEGVANETIRQRPEDGANSAFGMHQADAGSDAYDRDFALSLLGKEQDALYEINEALKRIEQGVYGICEMSGQKIPQERLEALPFTRYTVTCQERIERQQMGGRWARPVRSLFGLDDAGEESGDSSDEEEGETLDSSRD